MSGAMGSHQSARAKTTTWLTPPEIIKSLGKFDLDPCAAENQPWKTAEKQYTIADNGLEKPWEGRVWLNPPYGLEAGRWLEKLSRHNDGIALIFARTETKMFFDWVWNKAQALLFIEGRLHFHRIDGTRAKANAGAPSVLVAYGNRNEAWLEDVWFDNSINGAYIKNRRMGHHGLHPHPPKEQMI